MPDPFSGIAGVTLTVYRSGGVDQWGDDRPTIQHNLPNVVWAPSSSSKTADGSSTVITGRQIYGPPGGDLTATDRVSFPGEPADVRWEIVGDVGCWTDPFTGRAVGFEAAVRRVTG